MELKEQQPTFDVDQQIQNLTEKGLLIKDTSEAKKLLNEVSYFRLIKAYSLGLKEKNGNYHQGTSFEQIVELYSFNTRFRQIIFEQIERVEVTLRARIANCFSMAHGVLGYLNKDNFEDIAYHQDFLRDQRKEVNYNSRSPFIKNFKNNYDGGGIPLYALVEVLSFGTLSKFYRNMLPDDKKKIALLYGVQYTYLQSWIESLSHVRNICAHYGRLYNARLTKTPLLYREYTNKDVRNYHVFAALLCIKHLLPSDYRWELFIDSIGSLFDTYPHVRKKTMGFADHWQELLL